MLPLWAVTAASTGASQPIAGRVLTPRVRLRVFARLAAAVAMACLVLVATIAAAA